MLGKLLEGRKGLLLSTVRGTEWGQFLDYVHPSFFEVLGPRDLLAQGKELASNLADGHGFAALREEQAKLLGERAVPVRVEDSEPDAAADGRDPGELGQRILEVYFGQLFGGDATILDLRGGRWHWPAEASEPVWLPRPLWIRWQPEFLGAMRDMYRGFYADEDATFDRGLEAMNLGAAKDVLRAHFGEGDQRAVRFEVAAFHASFHQVFLRCREQGVALHRNFLPLGLYLACLYDALEGRGELDVRSAFDRVCG
jgi:hypothetical protein